MNLITKKIIPIICILLFLLTSCAGKGFIVDINEAPSDDQCIVFGKLTLIGAEGVEKWGEKFFEKPLLIILPPNSNIAHSYEIKDDGNFFWSLSPGEYTILGFGNFMSVSQKLPIRAKFNVPIGKKSLYIGNFLLIMQSNRFGCTIEDNSEISISKFKNKFHNIREEPSISIMETEPQPGSYDNIQYICDDKWGIKCENKYLGKIFNGVIPIYPEATAQPFKKISNAKSIFKWEASVNKNVTYDLIVYEAAAYYIDSIGKTYIPGRVVLLNEDIKDPSYQLTTELKPGTNYYWSVRLREGNDVSTWSLFHYFYFYVVGASSASNQWFTFSTPPNI
ncbi:MAG: hypothetical protein AB1545_11070 [Thermodesulfobacteriota bacterium]